MKLDSHALNREVASMFLLVGLEQVGPCLRFDTVIHTSEGASMRKLIIWHKNKLFVIDLRMYHSDF
jgi:hypothetical protein